MALPKLIPSSWLGPRRNQATQGNHRHKVGTIKSGYISQPLFSMEAPTSEEELVDLLGEYGLDTSEYVPGGGGGGTTFTRSTETITTASLADGATENDDFVFTASTIAYRLFNISCDRACRVRLYKTSAKRTADASRPIGTDVDIATDHGLIFEYVALGSISAMLSPAVDAFIPSGTDVFYAIQNNSGSSSAVEVVLTYIRTE